MVDVGSSGTGNDAVAPMKVASSSRTEIEQIEHQKLVSITSRPARKQATHREVENLRQRHDNANQAGLSYNIWYSKWSGGDNDDGRTSSTKATTRVNIARDAGYTRANAHNHQEGAYICLFFARGYCPNGADCSYLHMLPNVVPDQGHDVFGREKHGNFRDDMGGVGSIQRVNRTLYVGHIVEEADSTQWLGVRTNGKQAQSAVLGNDGKGWDWSMDKKRMSGTERVLYGHFSEFGEIERVRVLHTRGCGFVTFVREVDAQFAKEAMMHQSLDHDECINLRWATDDPNPVAQKRDRLAREKQGIEVMKANVTEEAIAAERTLIALEEEEDDVDDACGKRRRIEGANGDDEHNEMSEEEYRRLVEENEKNWREMERLDAELQEKALAEIAESETKALSKNGALFDAKSLEALKSMREKQTTAAVSAAIPAPSVSASALTGLAEYGSDSGEE